MSKSKSDPKPPKMAPAKRPKLNKNGNKTGMHGNQNKAMATFKARIKAPPHIPRNPLGQPPKLTDDLIDEFCDLVKRIFYLETVAGALELDMRSINNWRKIGKEEHLKMQEDDLYIIKDQHRERCHRFFLAAKKAMSQAEMGNVKKINRDETWQSKAWMLERRHPERYSSRSWEIKMLERQLNEMTRKLEKYEQDQRGSQRDD
jgi:hypothetical protein